jgi:hypothetical protein
LLGVLDHGTRAGLALQALERKTTVVVLRALLDLVERFGRPVVLRTDNEATFTSRLFHFALFVLGIRHQRTKPFAPLLAAVRNGVIPAVRRARWGSSPFRRRASRGWSRTTQPLGTLAFRAETEEGGHIGPADSTNPGGRQMERPGNSFRALVRTLLRHSSPGLA